MRKRRCVSLMIYTHHDRDSVEWVRELFYGGEEALVRVLTPLRMEGCG